MTQIVCDVCKKAIHNPNETIRLHDAALKRYWDICKTCEAKMSWLKKGNLG